MDYPKGSRPGSKKVGFNITIHGVADIVESNEDLKAFEDYINGKMEAFMKTLQEEIDKDQPFLINPPGGNIDIMGYSGEKYPKGIE